METNEYHKLAQFEDDMWYFHALYRRIAEAFHRAGVARHRPLRMLDAGCGTGGLIKHLGASFPQAEVVGLDFSGDACAFARERTGREIVQASIAAMPFAAESFDAVVSADVVCQLPRSEAPQAMRELARIARPGAPVIVNVPAHEWMRSYHDETCETRHRFERRELTALFAEAGLTVEFHSYVNCLPFPLIVARRKFFPQADKSSDVKLYPAPVEAAFALMAAAEFEWMDAGIPSPMGSSVFVVGRKPRA